MLSASKSPSRLPALEEAARALASGGLVVLPTDTVYGLGADPGRTQAIDRIFQIKARPSDQALPVLVANVEQAACIVSNLGLVAERLMAAFWPGPLTLVLPANPTARLQSRPSGSDYHSAPTVAIRQPDHQWTIELLQRTGPLAVTSANRSGQPPSLTVSEARQSFGSAVAVYLDAGPSRGGTASTVVDLTGSQPRLLREGPIGRHGIVSTLRGVVPEGVVPEGRAHLT
jgi:tRNA threonylcarbamoyl adenosine modification protein (Sua5/YciO/YrdC/YwlC family)